MPARAFNPSRTLRFIRRFSAEEWFAALPADIDFCDALLAWHRVAVDLLVAEVGLSRKRHRARLLVATSRMLLADDDDAPDWFPSDERLAEHAYVDVPAVREANRWLARVGLIDALRLLNAYDGDAMRWTPELEEPGR